MKYLLFILLLSGCVKSEFVKCKEFVVKDITTTYSKEQIAEGLKELNAKSVEEVADRYCRATLDGLPWNRGN